MNYTHSHTHTRGCWWTSFWENIHYKPKITTAQFSRQLVSTDLAGAFSFSGSCIIHQSLAYCETIDSSSVEDIRLKTCEMEFHAWKPDMMVSRSYQCECDLCVCSVSSLIWGRLALQGYKMGDSLPLHKSKHLHEQRSSALKFMLLQMLLLSNLLKQITTEWL